MGLLPNLGGSLTQWHLCGTLPGILAFDKNSCSDMALERACRRAFDERPGEVVQLAERDFR